MLRTIRKPLSFILVLALFFSLCIPAFATTLTQDNHNVIVIRSKADLVKMQEADLAEYEGKLNRIDPDLKNDVNQFLASHQELSAVQRSKSATIASDEDFLRKFIEANPEYKGSETIIADDVALVRANVVVEAVRAYYSAMGYDLALTLFNHSLTNNPADAELTLTGNTDGMYGHIRSELSDDPFLDKMIAFANKSGTESLTDWSHTFDSGDLYWAIHGFTWIRTRTARGRANFTIDDTYDFNKWKDIPGIVAGFAGTNDYEVYIHGSVVNGVIQ